MTSTETARSLSARIASDPVRAELVARPQPSLRDTVSWLLEQDGVDTVVVEAGPSAAESLYSDPPLVDELMLSVYRGAELAPEAIGGPFLSWQRLGERFRCSLDPASVHDDWAFHRLRA